MKADRNRRLTEQRFELSGSIAQAALRRDNEIVVRAVGVAEASNGIDVASAMRVVRPGKVAGSRSSASPSPSSPNQLQLADQRSPGIRGRKS